MAAVNVDLTAVMLTAGPDGLSLADAKLASSACSVSASALSTTSPASKTKRSST